MFFTKKNFGYSNEIKTLKFNLIFFSFSFFFFTTKNKKINIGNSQSQEQQINEFKKEINEIKEEIKKKNNIIKIKSLINNILLLFRDSLAIQMESACNAGDTGSIPGLGRSSGEGNDYPFQHSYLENSMDTGV